MTSPNPLVLARHALAWLALAGFALVLPSVLARAFAGCGIAPARSTCDPAVGSTNEVHGHNPRRPPTARARAPPCAPADDRGEAPDVPTRSQQNRKDHTDLPTTVSPRTSERDKNTGRDREHAENGTTHDKPEVKQLTSTPFPGEEIR